MKPYEIFSTTWFPTAHGVYNRMTKDPLDWILYHSPGYVSNFFVGMQLISPEEDNEVYQAVTTAIDTEITHKPFTLEKIQRIYTLTIQSEIQFQDDAEQYIIERGTYLAHLEIQHEDTIINGWLTRAMESETHRNLDRETELIIKRMQALALEGYKLQHPFSGGIVRPS